MTTAATAEVTETPELGAARFEMVPIGSLHESAKNPRRHFDGLALNELAESIRKAGVLTPLLVRPNKKGFEIAAGHRRHRAAKMAGELTVPCIIREMPDQLFLEILTIENLQREDVHPLDEAQGYEALMAAPYHMKVETIAQKVGKSEKYIYDRVKLLALIPALQTVFWDGGMESGHAILLARLTPAEQATVMGTKKAEYTDGGLFVPEQDLYHEPDREEAIPRIPIKANSVREVDAWIKRHIRFNAKHADTFLFPETVEQVTEATQAKRKIIEITHEYIASGDVRSAGDAKVYGERAWKRADGREGSTRCNSAVLGVIVSGFGQGQAFDVCVDKARCLEHWGKDIRAHEKRAKSGTASTAPASAKELKRQAKEKATQERLTQRRAQWEKVTPKIQAEVMEKVKKLPATAQGLLGDVLVREIKARLWHVPKPAMAGTPGKTAEDLVRYLGALVLLDRVQHYDAFEKFPPDARALGVDLSPFVKTPSQTSASKAEPAKTEKPGKTGKRGQRG